MKTNLSNIFRNNETAPHFPSPAVLVKLFGAALTGMLSFFSAVLTTVVESGGFWQYFWLGFCLLNFICALSLVVLAGQEGSRADRLALRFESLRKPKTPEQ